MIVLAILTLILLTVLNYYLSGKSALYPPVVFCGSWAASLFLIATSGDLFFQVHAETLTFIMVGVSCFSIACWCGLAGSLSQKTFPLSPSSQKIITWLVVFAIIGTPLYLKYMANIVSTSGLEGPFLQVAVLASAAMTGTDDSFRAAGLFSELSLMIACIALWNSEGHRKRTILAICAAFILSIPRGAKSTPFVLVISLMTVDWLKTRKLRWKLAVSVAAILVSVAFIFEFYVHLGGKGTLTDRLYESYSLVALHASGGIIGLDHVMRHPNAVPHINPIYVTWLRIIRRLGGRADIPENAAFIDIGPTLDDNVYTAFWSYLNLGYFGCILAMSTIGFLVTKIYRSAIQGNPAMVPLYGKLVFALAFSTFTEYFVSSIYIYAVLLTLCWGVYFLPAQVMRFRLFCHQVAQKDLSRALRG